MLNWSRSELRTLALWHFNLAWQLNDDDWTIVITHEEGSITCDRPSLDNDEAAQIGREMMIRTFAMRDVEHWRGKITVRRKSDLWDPDWRP